MRPSCGGDDAGHGAGGWIDEVGDLAGVAVAASSLSTCEFLVRFEDLQGIIAPSEVVVHGRVLKIHGVSHVETKPLGHGPTAFGGHGGTAGYGVLREDMVDLAADLGVALCVDVWGGRNRRRQNRRRECVDQQAATGFLAIQKTVLSPGRGLGHAAKSCAQWPAIAALVMASFTHFHSGQKRRHMAGIKSSGGRGSIGDFPGLCAGASHGFFAKDMFAAG